MLVIPTALGLGVVVTWPEPVGDGRRGRLLPVTGTPFEFPGSAKDAARQTAQPLETGAREEQEDEHCVVSSKFTD